MMEIIAHRGFWKDESEKNSLVAIERAFSNGYGIETDVRDYNGKLVVSHNIATDKCPDFEEVFKLYNKHKCEAKLAINIKADGIQKQLMMLLEKYNIDNYFLFDMSVPELVVNEAMGLKYYTRHSDIEESCVMYDRADGVWLDSFYNRGWINSNIIRKHLEKNKKVCIVSSELHGWDNEKLWLELKESGIINHNSVVLCSDYPDEAKAFFYE